MPNPMTNNPLKSRSGSQNQSQNHKKKKSYREATPPAPAPAPGPAPNGPEKCQPTLEWRVNPIILIACRQS